ncbi:MAG: menaquinone biosynthesis protein [Bacteroidia bacterium]|nr:menaquinone biosynthesis protein [Bacteroidia bacterium]
MEPEYRISCVTYLNSLPFIHGLKHSGFLRSSRSSLSLDIPSQCAEKMLQGAADVGILPVAMIPAVKDLRIISDLCIGADGPVGSVMLFSRVPLDQIKTVYLDYHSRTSAVLVRILARNWWKINPEWKQGSPGFEDRVEGETAALIIGDRALEREGKYPYIFDLAEHWKLFTGLPFVFAVWMGKRSLPESYLTPFNQALEAGVSEIPALVQTLPPSFIAPERVKKYLENNIHYRLDDAGKEAIRQFLEFKAGLGL